MHNFVRKMVSTLCVNLYLRWRDPTPSEENVTFIPKTVAFDCPLQDGNGVRVDVGKIGTEYPMFLP